MKPALALLALASVAAVVAAREPQRPKITGVAHMALYVHDMAKARAYYTGFLGLGEPFAPTNPDGSTAVAFIKSRSTSASTSSSSRNASPAPIASITAPWKSMMRRPCASASRRAEWPCPTT